MTGFARWVIRASYVLFGLAATVILLGMAVEGYWTLFFPFLLIVALWVWWVRAHPPDFR